MGVVRIVLEGSFPNRGIEIPAARHGHAHALNEGIRWLTDRMTEAINLDHELHEQGAKPDDGFIKE